jgi:mono/diheme cytochrome c family protein
MPVLEIWEIGSVLRIAFAFALLAGLASGPAPAQELDFSEEFMTDMANIRAGREHFQAQCGHCHGSRAYPGKAPRLQPERYDPDFIYWAIRGGYGRMPSFEDHFTHEETMQIVAWIKSNLFSH